MIMVHITKIRKNKEHLEAMQWQVFVSDLRKALTDAGFDYQVKDMKIPNSFTVSQVRLSDDYVKKHGYNISPYSNRRGRVLGWKDWVRFNNTLNTVMDRHRISANATSLHGKFKIRKGGVAYTESDWEGIGEENVGSQMNLIRRKEAWRSEKE